MAGEAMTAAANRDLQLVGMREFERARDIINRGASRDDCRIQIDGVIPHPARFSYRASLGTMISPLTRSRFGAARRCR